MTASKPETFSLEFPISHDDWTDADIQRARDLAARADRIDHTRTVANVCETVIERIKAGDVTEDDVSDAVSEACDGVLIYTSDCEAFLRASDNDEAWTDCYAADEMPADYVRAGLALEADVLEALSDAGYGYNGEAWDTDEESEETPVVEA